MKKYSKEDFSGYTYSYMEDSLTKIYTLKNQYNCLRIINTGNLCIFSGFGNYVAYANFYPAINDYFEYDYIAGKILLGSDQQVYERPPYKKKYKENILIYTDALNEISQRMTDGKV